MGLIKLLLTGFTLGGCGDLEETVFQQFLLWEGVVFLNELFFKFLLWEHVVDLK